MTALRLGPQVDDLKGIARLAMAAPLARFLSIGIVSTLAHAVLYLLLAGPLGAALGNATALAATAVANTAANRRLTFGVQGREHMLRDQARGGVVFLVALAMTTGALAVLHAVDPAPARGLQLTVLIVANLAATVTRYVALRTWVFARGRREATHTLKGTA
jgi:putative flippase GtrA